MVQWVASEEWGVEMWVANVSIFKDVVMAAMLLRLLFIKCRSTWDEYRLRDCHSPVAHSGHTLTRRRRMTYMHTCMHAYTATPLMSWVRRQRRDESRAYDHDRRAQH